MLIAHVSRSPIVRMTCQSCQSYWAVDIHQFQNFQRSITKRMDLSAIKNTWNSTQCGNVARQFTFPIPMESVLIYCSAVLVNKYSWCKLTVAKFQKCPNQMVKSSLFTATIRYSYVVMLSFVERFRVLNYSQVSSSSVPWCSTGRAAPRSNV